MCRESSSNINMSSLSSLPPATPQRKMDADSSSAAPVTPAPIERAARRVLDVAQLDLERRQRRDNRKQQELSAKRRVMSASAFAVGFKRQRSSYDMPPVRLLPLLEQQVVECQILDDSNDNSIEVAYPQDMPVAVPIFDHAPAVSFDESDSDSEDEDGSSFNGLVAPPLLPLLDWNHVSAQAPFSLTRLRPRSVSDHDDALDFGSDNVEPIEDFPLFPMA